MNKRHIYRGFTLIELLVVIAIIGILSTLAIVALGSARQKARDSKRVADLNQIGKALELYYNDNNSYPTIITPGQPIASGSTTYLAQVPSNPTPRNEGGCGNYNYVYEGALNGTGYTLSACLSGATGSIPAGPVFVSSAGGGGVAGCGSSIVDRDGYVYRTVRIGTQCWMADNLNTKTLPNGTQMTYPDRDCIAAGNVQGTETDCSVGYTLYRAAAALNGDALGGQGICPSGWHMPTDTEWHTLELGFTIPAGTEASCPASRGSSFSLCPDVGTALKAGGASGFNGVTTGFRNNSLLPSSYSSYGLTAYFLGYVTSSSYTLRAIGSSQNGLGLAGPGGNSGSSVRCIKN